MGLRQLFDGRRFKLLAAARGLIFLGQHADDVVARVQQGSEGWHGELRRAHEDEASHAEPPSRCRGRIRAIDGSQQRAASNQVGQRLDIRRCRAVVRQVGRVLADLGVCVGCTVSQPRRAVGSQIDRLGRGEQFDGQHIADIVQNLQCVPGCVGAHADVIFLVGGRGD